MRSPPSANVRSVQGDFRGGIRPLSAASTVTAPAASSATITDHRAQRLIVNTLWLDGPNQVPAAVSAPNDVVQAHLGPRERGDAVESGQLVGVADGEDVGDATVLDGEAHRGVELTTDLDPAPG